MKTAVRCLHLLAVLIICETFTVTEDEFQKLQISEPDGCEVSTSSLLAGEYAMTCPGFSMEMSTHDIERKPSDPPNQQLREELRSTVYCSNNSPPYKDLRLTNSKRNSLMLENCPLPEHESFGEGWPDLEIFKYENYGNIELLTRQHFSGLNDVWTLILFINSSHHMADDVLSDLTNLTEIHMSVQQANKNIFKNLIKLEWLHITIDSREGLDNFDTSEMKHLPAFKTLELVSNSFTRLTKPFFDGCPYVETLIFKYNTIDGIDGNAFEPLTNLKHVSMSMNTMKQLSTLPEGLFSKNRKLETFSINSYTDSITSLPAGLFSNLPNLREVTIHCKLYGIPGGLIRGSTNLELLNLQFNRLTSMPRELLANHSKLKKIELYGNDFGDTPSENLFDNKSPLTEIRFDYED